MVKRLLRMTGRRWIVLVVVINKAPASPEGILQSMVCNTINKTAVAIMLAVCFGLGRFGPVCHAQAAALVRPIGQSHLLAQFQASPPEPATLIRSYEASLAPYSRMKGRWTVQLEKSEPAEENPRKSIAEWAVFRDQDRLRLLETRDSEKGHTVFDCVRQGKQLISVYPSGSVLGWLHPSVQDELDRLGSSLCSPCYGIIDGEWIPDFLRMAKTSMQADTLDGRPVYRLRGLTMHAKIELWIDPSLDYAARRTRFDKRATDGDSTVRSRQFDATRFRLEKGHSVVTEATTTLSVGPQPVLSPMAVEKIVNGKRVMTKLPAKDQAGNVIMSQRRHAWKITLRDIDFDPKWIDRDFELSRPIANGTKVEMQDARDSNYVWKDGRIVLIAPGRGPK